MCGIIGYVGDRRAVPFLLTGLSRLEYRGYDSAGLATYNTDRIHLVRKVGRVANLTESASVLEGSTGIAHTRWATHGGVSESNAHPHQSSDGQIFLVHNGVIENERTLRQWLGEQGFSSSTETDSEVLANLIGYHLQKEPEDDPERRLLRAVRKALRHVSGTYGIAVMSPICPKMLVAARLGSPLVIAPGKGESFVASDVSAVVGNTDNVVYMKDGEVAAVWKDDLELRTLGDEPVTVESHPIAISLEEAELGDFEHFMLKEIFEQPETIRKATRGRFSEDLTTSKLGGLNLDPVELRRVKRIVLLGCGTAWHACLEGKYLIERWARIPVEVDYASEFRYRNSPLETETLFFVVSQSGETQDTLAALREAKRKGFHCLAITNTVGSSIAQDASGGIYQHAGQEVGVASTKAFTSQLSILALIALYLGRMRGLSIEDGRALVEAFQKLPDQINTCLESTEQIRAIARRYAGFRDFLFLGRVEMFPIALEGALKLKEISYIHAEGYPAAEMKHGPIALISEECPSVFLLNKGPQTPKTLANIQEVRARKGPIIVVGTEGLDFDRKLCDEWIPVPDCHPALQPILFTIPLQLLSYYIAVELGCDVDKPRNLAKSVTVE